MLVVVISVMMTGWFVIWQDFIQESVAVFVMRILPSKYSCTPNSILLGFLAELTQSCRIYISSISSILRSSWLSDYDFIFRNSVSNEISNCSVVEFGSFAMNKQSLVSNVLGISLVIELNIVIINQVSNLIVDGHISAVDVVTSSNEIRGLGSMGEEIFAFR